MTGAAGFKRDGAPDPGLTGFSYNDPNGPPSNTRFGGNATQSSSFGIN